MGIEKLCHGTAQAFIRQNNKLLSASLNMEKAWRFEEVRNNTCVAWARMWICVHRCSQLKGGAWIRDKACKPHQMGRHMAMEPRRTISNAANFTKNIRNWPDTSLPPPPFAAFTARIGATDSCITLLGNETLCVAWLFTVSGEEEDSSSFPFCDLIFTRFTSKLIIFQVLEFSQSFNPLSLKILLCSEKFPAYQPENPLVWIPIVKSCSRLPFLLLPILPSHDLSTSRVCPLRKWNANRVSADLETQNWIKILS